MRRALKRVTSIFLVTAMLTISCAAYASPTIEEAVLVLDGNCEIVGVNEYTDVGEPSVRSVVIPIYTNTYTDHGPHYYFPSNYIDVLENNTAKAKDFSYTFSETTGCTFSGSLDCNTSGEQGLNAKFGFDYWYTKSSSKSFGGIIESGNQIRVFVLYQKITIDQTKYNGGMQVSTSTRNVYKPVGLTFYEYNKYGNYIGPR